MPTSMSEAHKIASIINEYIGQKVAKELKSRLDEEVGQQSDNDSLKVSLQMLKMLYNK